MATTTTAINACDVRIFMDNAAGTLTEISGSSNQANLNFDNNLGELFAFASKWPTRLECGKDAAFDFSIIYSTTATEAASLVNAWFFADPPGNRTFEIYVPNKNVGSDKFSGEFKIDTYSVPLTAGEGAPIIMSLSILPDGEVAHTTAAT